MLIWPAIDLRGGKCVRLRQGDYEQETVFGEDPVAMARSWIDQGAERLHLVDLDGARDGHRANRAALQAILAEVDVPCQVGGGIRDSAAIADLVKLGVSRLVVGTQAIKDPDWFRRMARQFPDRMVLGIDARNGLVATDGWREVSQMEATELARQFADEPLAALVYTDIARDGMLAGPNLEAMDEMRRSSPLEVVASGGVTTVEDIRQLARIGMGGCIVGRALYEGRIRLSEALEAARVN